MTPATRKNRIEGGPHGDAELATLYGGLPEPAGQYPLLVEAWEDEGWDEETELDAQIFAGLLRISP